MTQKAKQLAKKVAGFVLIFLGIIFLITPFTPGAALLFFGGLELLGLRLIFEEKIIGWWKKIRSKFTNRD